jgi:hypothetical protein
LLRDPLAAYVRLNRKLGRTKLLQHFYQLCNFLLAFRRQNVVGLHVVDVASRICHVRCARHQNFRLRAGLAPSGD